VVIIKFYLLYKSSAKLNHKTISTTEGTEALRATLRRAQRLIGFKITSPALLLVFSVVIIMFYLFYHLGKKFNRKTILTTESTEALRATQRKHTIF
jgi:hypothetical protein